MSIEHLHAPTFDRSKARLHPLRRLSRVLLAIVTSQYLVIAIGVGLAVAATVNYAVAPRLVSQFQAIAAAVKR
jgi:hypothetical protein